MSCKHDAAAEWNMHPKPTEIIHDVLHALWVNPISFFLFVSHNLPPPHTLIYHSSVRGNVAGFTALKFLVKTGKAEVFDFTNGCGSASWKGQCLQPISHIFDSIGSTYLSPRHRFVIGGLLTTAIPIPSIAASTIDSLVKNLISNPKCTDLIRTYLVIFIYPLR